MPTEPAVSVSAPPCRLLVVEDDALVREVIVRVARRENFVVVVAPHGGEALARLARGRFDVMMTDIYMPETDGIELMTQARELDPAMPIVAISGGGEFGFSPLRAATLLGAAHVLPKPFEITQLAWLLQAARMATAKEFAQAPAAEADKPAEGSQVACG